MRGLSQHRGPPGAGACTGRPAQVRRVVTDVQVTVMKMNVMARAMPHSVLLSLRPVLLLLGCLPALPRLSTGRTFKPGPGHEGRNAGQE